MIPEESAGRFALRVSRTNRSHGDNQYRIVVTDEVSRLQVAELFLTAQQFAEAITGLNVSDIPGAIPAPKYRSRLGLKMEHFSVKKMEHFSVNLPHAMSSKATQLWVEQARMCVQPDSVDVTKVRDGKQVTFRWYRDPASEPLLRSTFDGLIPPVPA